MKAIIYIRVSTEEQAKTGLSLENQEKACKEFAKNKGYEVLKVFREEGVSAKTADRKELISLIDHCREHKGEIDALIVWKVDRFARKAEDHLTIKALLAKYGVKLYSVTEPIEDNTMGRLMETMLAAFAQFDNEVRTERSTKGLYSRVEQGGWPFYAPLGYLNYKDSLGRPTLKPDPARAELVARLFSEYSGGNHTSKSIAQFASDIGLKSRANHRLSKQTMFNILTNRVYCGQVKSRTTGNYLKGLHKALITEDLFIEVQAVIAGKGKKLKPVKDLDWPLRAGFVRCSDCGNALTGSSPKGRSSYYPRYSCTTCKARKTGKAVSVPRDKLHKEFSLLLEVVRPDDKYLELFKSVMLREWNNEFKALGVHRAQVDKDLKTLEGKRQRVLDLFIDGRLTDDDRDIQLAKIESDRVALKLQQKDLMNDVEDKEVVIDLALDFMKNVARYWKSAPLPLQKRFQYLVFPEGINYDFVNGFGTAKLGAAYEVIKDLDSNSDKAGGGTWT